MPRSQTQMPHRPIFEVCVDTPAGLAAAVENGADRIELCAALGLSGLTPSAGLMALAAKSCCPTYAMIRPREGDFIYSAQDLDLMRWEIDAVRTAGLAGVVFGANRGSGELDAEALELLLGHAKGLGVTLHRAFDLAPDLAAAMEVAVALGFERILTSGGEPNAVLGATRIAGLVAQSRGRISIMAGSGVTAVNVAELLASTGAPEVHASCRGVMTVGLGGDRAELAKTLGFASEAVRDTDGQKVAELARALEAFAGSGAAG